jgi:hypothetical protein
VKLSILLKTWCEMVRFQRQWDICENPIKLNFKNFNILNLGLALALSILLNDAIKI